MNGNCLFGKEMNAHRVQMDNCKMCEDGRLHTHIPFQDQIERKSEKDKKKKTEKN